MKIFGFRIAREKTIQAEKAQDAREKAKRAMDEIESNRRQAREYVAKVDTQNAELSQKLMELERNYHDVCFYHSELNEKYKALRDSKPLTAKRGRK